MSAPIARDHTQTKRNDSRANVAAALVSAAAVLLAGAPLALIHEFGHLSQHMGLHILSMNVAAPIAAALIVGLGAPRAVAPALLWTLATAQILVLWFLHTPRFHALAAHGQALAFAVHGLLACLALGFWVALLRLDKRQRWHAPAALLLTGKLACLLAAFLIFSPRLLYSALEHAHGAHISLSDQQLAGLLMIVACPLSYLIAAVLITLELIGPQDAAGAEPPADKTPRYAP
jgi:putative membrane protein